MAKRDSCETHRYTSTIERNSGVNAGQVRLANILVGGGGELSAGITLHDFC